MGSMALAVALIKTLMPAKINYLSVIGCETSIE